MEKIKRLLQDVVGREHVSDDPEIISSYLEDQTGPGSKIDPCAEIILVRPGTSKEISQILKMANKFKIPVFVRGGGTGLSCGSVPNRPGILISMERFKGIEIDEENMMAEVEAGVTLGELIKEAEAKGLFFPPHPGDEGAQIGGMVSCAAVGARAFRTGGIRNYVLGMEVVLPTGEILRLGGELIKDNTSAGKLMHLFIGTEGIFGIITKVWLRLFPLGGASATIVVPFNKREDATSFGLSVVRSGIVPLGVEYMEKEVVEAVEEKTGEKWPCKEGDYFVILFLNEFGERCLEEEYKKILELCDKFNSLEALVAESLEERRRILKIRSEAFPSLRPMLFDGLDISVPPARISELLKATEDLSRKYGIKVLVMGHIADGNVHHQVFWERGRRKEEYEQFLRELYEKAKELGGVLSGEHGIGESKIPFLEIFLGKEEINVLRKIKEALDPNWILNPGKVIPQGSS